VTNVALGVSAPVGPVPARKAVVVARDEDDYREGELAEVASNGEGADLGARRAWTCNEEEVGEVRGVRIDIHRPTLDG